MEHKERLKAALADRYQIEREIGSGGMATVYLAQDLKHDRQVAIKVLRPELAVTLGSDRFVQEIEIAAKLSHPHILPLHDSGEAGGILYYVMPYVEGESLRERLDREGKLSVAEAVRLTDEIASALSYAHERGVVHRDVKPENIMLSGGRAVVADFGIGRAVTAAGGDRLTGTGFAVGTPAYMSPEQAYGDASVDGRSDVYALGCVAFEMVSGRQPFEADTPQALLAKQAAGTVPSLRARDATIPLFFERAVERALAKSPDERFQSVSEFAEALTSEMVVARPGGGRRAWRAIAASAAGVVLVMAWVLSTVLGRSAYERLAVLPPTNLMNDPEQEYLVQGMHDALISELQMAGVPVIARTSVTLYQNTQTPISEIVAELGVDALIESTIFRAEDSVEMVVRLVDGRTQQYVTEPITRAGEFRNVLALYRDLTRAIASEIHAALTPQAEARLATAREVNPEAYEAYLKGTYHHDKVTQQDLDIAESYFELALEKDSSYAAAYAGLSAVWGARNQMGYAPPHEAYPKEKAFTLKAIELDDGSWLSHRRLASMRTWREWDWAGAESEWQRALELDPNAANTHAFFAHFLAITGRIDEAIPHSERALELDPFNVLYHGLYAMVLCGDRRYEDAMAEARITLTMQAGEPLAFRALDCALPLVSDERRDEQLALLLEQLASDAELIQVFEQGLAEAGYQEAYRRMADLLVERQEKYGDTEGPSSEPMSIATKYLIAGDYDRALDWLETAYEAHSPNAPYISFEPQWDPLRPDLRFQDLLRRMNLPIGLEGN